jgi:hypothetical protein
MAQLCRHAGYDRNDPPRGWLHITMIVGGIMVVHAILLGWGAWRNSFTWDEVGHLPAGISHWQLGRFDLFRVNPPLVRMVGSLPILAAKPKTDWRAYDDRPGHRAEFDVGKRFLELNGVRSFWLLTLARWTCIPFSLLGGWVCFRWAGELYGERAGLLALVLWCFSPNVLAHGQLITPDVAAAALGVSAAFLFWRWLKRPSWDRTLAAGLLLGLTELAKTTWIVLFLSSSWDVWERFLKPNNFGERRRFYCCLAGR